MCPCSKGFTCLHSSKPRSNFWGKVLSLSLTLEMKRFLSYEEEGHVQGQLGSLERAGIRMRAAGLQVNHPVPPSPSAVPNIGYHPPFGDLFSRQKLHSPVASHWPAGLLKAPESHLNSDFYLIFHLTKQCQREGVWWYLLNMIYEPTAEEMEGLLAAPWPLSSAFLMFALLPWPCKVTWNSSPVSLCVSTFRAQLSACASLSVSISRV